MPAYVVESDGRNHMSQIFHSQVARTLGRRIRHQQAASCDFVPWFLLSNKLAAPVPIDLHADRGLSGVMRVRFRPPPNATQLRCQTILAGHRESDRAIEAVVAQMRRRSQTVRNSTGNSAILVKPETDHLGTDLLSDRQPCWRNKWPLQLGVLTIVLAAAEVPSVLAHTVSAGYDQTSNSSVEVWFGTYHSGVTATEGSVHFVGTSYDQTSIFSDLVHTKPSGLVDGTNNFYSGLYQGKPSGLVSTPITGVDFWQGATFSNLRSGTYTYTYIPISNPTSTWQPYPDVLTNSFTIVFWPIRAGQTYLASNLGTTVDPVFRGGSLQTDQANGAYSQNFTLDGSGANTIDQTGNASTFSGVFSNAVSGTPGSIIIANSTTGGSVTFSGVSTYTGATTIGTGAALALAGAGSIATSSGVADNGTFDISATTSGASIASLSGSGVVALGAQTLALTGAAGTFAGAIGGTGGLAITGGMETLTGTSTYSGGTSVGNATLAINGDAALGAPAGNLALTNATLAALTNLSSGRTVSLTGSDVVDTGGANAVALSGAIGGSGGLTLSGGGTVTLTGTNTYGGGTSIIDATTLAIGADAALGATSGGLTFNSGILTATSSFNSARPVVLAGAGTVNTGGNSVSLSGTTSGSGALTATGGGVLTLSGANTYAGGTTITGGTKLQVTSDAALGAAAGGITLGDTGTTGALVALNSFTSGRSILVNAGGGLIDANGNILTLTGTVTQIGVLQSTGGLGGQVLFNGPTTVMNFVVSGGASSNTGFVNAAAGVVVNSDGTFSNSGTVDTPTLVVNGTSINTGTVNAVTSSTVGTGGVLSNDGTLNSPSLTVNGELRGTGTVNAPTTVTGTLAPGNSPGTLTFAAPVTLTSTSTTEFDIDGAGTGTGAGNYSRVIVTGTGNTFTADGNLAPRLRSITGDASNAYTPPIGQQFQVINAAGGIPATSGYTSLTQPIGLAAGTRFDALYAPTTLTLVITPAAYGNLALAGIGETSGEQSVGSALDAIRPAAGVRMSTGQQSLFYPLYTLQAAQIPGALDRLSPVAYGDGLMATRQGWYEGAASITDQLADRRSGLASANAAAGPLGTTVWVNGLGQFTDVSVSGATGYHTSLGGAIAGIDKALTAESLVGVAVGGSSVQVSTGNGATVSGNLVQFSIYGGVHSGQVFLDGQADYIHADQQVRRDLGFAGSSSGGSAPLQGGGAQVNGGIHFDVNRLQVEPTLGLTAMSLASASTTETTGSALAEQIRGMNTTSVQSFTGVRLATVLNLTPTLPVRLRGLVGWSHELADATVRTPASFASLGDTGTFSATTAPVGRDAARLAAGLDVNVAPNVALYASYSASLARDMTEQNLTGGVRVRW
jgi:fibronectin-binding autotransporter adhesin